MSETLKSILSRGRIVAAQRPWPRAVVDAKGWRGITRALSEGALTLLSLWGERDAVHSATLDNETGEIAVFSLDCPEGRFPSVGVLHAPAIRQERAIADLFGLKADGAADARPWLDHGHWDVRYPLSSAPIAAEAATYDFLAVDGEGLHRVNVGPVHAGIIEPGHFHFTANGEAVVRLEERLGFVHRGLEGLMIDADLGKGAKLAARASGDSTVAYAIAFARAAEAALGLQVPQRAHWLRALMAELERLANHLGDIGAICNDASFTLMHAHCSILRELVLRAADACFGHRLMRDCALPGGVAKDLDSRSAEALRALLAEIRRRFPKLVEVYDETASVLDRTVGTGILKPELARRFGAGGYVGRASGRAFDARKHIGYAPYDQLAFEVPVLDAGDVNARVWIRIRDVEQSLSLIEQIIAQMPAGALTTPLPRIGEACEGIALVEGFRGDLLVWLRLDAQGRIARCHLRDPSWFQWPLLEAAIEGNIIADFPICNKSFNCAYAGHDL